MNTAVEKIHILAAEQGSLEDVLGPDATDVFANAILNPPAPNAEALAAAERYLAGIGQNPETDSAPFPPEPVQTEYIAHIDAVDYSVDQPIQRGPIDVLVGTSRIVNPA